MSGKQPNIVYFFWDNFGWGELGCYGGGVLRGAPTPRIDKFAGEGLKLGCLFLSGLRILIGSSPERTEASARKIQELFT